MKRKGRNVAVSLQNNAIVNAIQCTNKYLIFPFWRNSIKNKNDNKEKSNNSNSGLFGMCAVVDTKSGCAQ